MTPASLYVAQTIGSPAMNLLKGRASVSDGALSLSGNGWNVRINGTGAASLIARLTSADDVITAGIRPEDLDLTGPGPALSAGPCIRRTAGIRDAL